MGNLSDFVPNNPQTDPEESPVHESAWEQPESQEHNESVQEPKKAPESTTSVQGVIQGYYEGEIQSETLDTYRKKWNKSSEPRREGEDEDAPKKKRKGFRLLDKPEVNEDEVFSDNANPTIADLLVNGADWLSDKAINAWSDYTVTDPPDLQDKRAALSKSMAELFDLWGWKLSKEAKVLLMLGVYTSAKSRHLVKKEDGKKEGTKEEVKKKSTIIDITDRQDKDQTSKKGFASL